jgi:hypothetical protein
MSDTLTALDATFLELEQQDEGALMGIGGVSVFDPLPGGGAPSVGGDVREPGCAPELPPALLPAALLDMTLVVNADRLDTIEQARI